jgi:hypothetical protein
MSAVYMPSGAQRLDDWIALEEARDLADKVLMHATDPGREPEILTTARELVEQVRSDLPRGGTHRDRADAAVRELRHAQHGRAVDDNLDAAVHDITELMRGLR